MAVSQVQYGGLATFTAAILAYSAPPIYIGWGTNTGADPARTANNLVVPAPENRATGTLTVITTTNANDTFQVSGTLTATAARAITEVGTFTASANTSNTLNEYGSFAVINLNAGDSITFNIKTTFS